MKLIYLWILINILVKLIAYSVRLLIKHWTLYENITLSVMLQFILRYTYDTGRVHMDLYWTSNTYTDGKKWNYKKTRGWDRGNVWEHRSS